MAEFLGQLETVVVVHQLDRVTNCHQFLSPQPLALLQLDAWIDSLSVGKSSLARSSGTSASRPPTAAFPGEPSSLKWYWLGGDFLSLGYREIPMNVLPS